MEGTEVEALIVVHGVEADQTGSKFTKQQTAEIRLQFDAYPINSEIHYERDEEENLQVCNDDIEVLAETILEEAIYRIGRDAELKICVGFVWSL